MSGFKTLSQNPRWNPKTDSVSCSRDKESFFEELNKKYRREEIYKVDLAKFRDESDPVVDYEALDESDKLEVVKRQIQFFRDRGFKIKVIDEGDLYLIYAEKNEGGS